jgi:hypothetical protein
MSMAFAGAEPLPPEVVTTLRVVAALAAEHKNRVKNTVTRKVLFLKFSFIEYSFLSWLDFPPVDLIVENKIVRL